MSDSDTARVLFPSSYTDKPAAPQPAPADDTSRVARMMFPSSYPEARAEAQDAAVAPHAHPAPDPVQRDQRPPDGQDGPSARDVLYDLPEDGTFIDYGEPDLNGGNVLEDVPAEMLASLAPGESEQMGEGLAVLGHTLSREFVRRGIEASRRGPLSYAEIERMNAGSMQQLQARWGSQTAVKVGLAREMIAEAEAKWPGLRDYLNRTGLGSDPRLIQQLAARAERRPGRNR